MRTMRKSLGVAVLAMATVLPAGIATAAQAAPDCRVTWGSQEKSGTASAGNVDGLSNVRSGRHECYDRLVLDGAWWVEAGYVEQVFEDGSGKVVPLRGGAKLQLITSRSDDVHTGEPIYTPNDPKEVVDVTGYSTFRQVAWAGDFEAHTTLGVGVRARLPFRVFVLNTPGRPPRTVIDVAHHW